MDVAHDAALRPFERRIIHLKAEGVDEGEIGRRFRRRPETIRRVVELAAIPHGSRPVSGDVLRPLERRVLRWRAQGAELTEIAARFRRSPGFMAQVERLAHFKLEQR